MMYMQVYCNFYPAVIGSMDIPNYLLLSRVAFCSTSLLHGAVAHVAEVLGMDSLPIVLYQEMKTSIQISCMFGNTLQWHSTSPTHSSAEIAACCDLLMSLCVSK